MLVADGGHLEFSHEKVNEKNGKFFQSFRVNISEKSQLFNIYMKKSQNDTTYTTDRETIESLVTLLMSPCLFIACVFIFID